MVTRSDYPKDDVEACLSVLVEFMTLLGEFRDSIVLIGGWVPYFLAGEEEKAAHIGSLDIDAALDFKNISSETYSTILELLKEKGYEQGQQPYIFFRHVETGTGSTVTVTICLLAGEYGGTSITHRTQIVQNVRARKARGCDLAFEEYFTVSLSRKMPDGANSEVKIRIAGVVPFLVMKGMALWERYKEKDAYDIYFSILHYPGGIEKLADEFRKFTSNRLVQEGLRKIKAKFLKIDSVGPVWATVFEEIEDEDERKDIQRDVFERVNALLDMLDIKRFEG